MTVDGAASPAGTGVDAVVDAVVVGGGIGGLVAAWELSRRGARVVVLEASERPGGPVRGGAFELLPGVPIDLGAESFAVRGGVVERLAVELGLRVESPVAAGAWGFAAGKAFPLPAAGVLGIPSRPWAADVRRAVGWPGALRGSLDRVLPRRFADLDDLGALARSRMGRRITDRLVTAVAAGVHSAPLERLDVDAVAPGLRRAFAETGSLSRAVSRLRAAAPPGAAVRGVEGGVHALVDTLADRLDVRTGHRVTGIDAGRRAGPGGDWTITADTRDGSATFHADRLVVATAGVAPLLARRWSGLSGPATPAGAGAEPQPPVPERGADIWLATLLVAAPELDSAPRGTGMLVAPGAAGPGGRGRRPVRAKALTHSTAKWPWLAERVREAAGPGMHVVRLSYGRIGEPTRAPTPEEAASDASGLLGVDLTGRVRDVMTQHWDGALPPPTPAYRERVREFLDAAARVPGLTVTGGWVAGTGLAAIVAHARAAVATGAPGGR
ncbi:protoporphyrinogen/coproporphyrinogen oxidase [Myceligenerans xiligouense]|uniref:Oxygen-dependent protoporphyrinogen oxidase n=1 Tax=Myceligenerans xiligouense TaxID=253184 RepID=A0A3N4ZBL2_9MICO|nr:FAD-dependent oxidoreductase [Myceligenerans xiligouense]RPF23268.1 oxygen-dependent protoporphyrinogen oxidase [Myceligenerans xiligouense]